MIEVEIVDVTLRDGLQLLVNPVPLDAKLALLSAAAAAGLRRLEVGSFVKLTQFADTPAVLAAAKAVPGLSPGVLVPNRKGFDLAIIAGAPEVIWVVSASEEHNQANLRRTIEASLAEVVEVLGEAAGAGIRVRLALATAFHCPFTGPTPHGAVFRILDRVLERRGVSEIVLADTIGHAWPSEVARLFAAVSERYPGFPFALHAHDTLGRAIANIEAAYGAGCRMFDGALAGLGGCPYAPGASGNVSTEDAVAFFAARGVETGVNMAALAEAGAIASAFGAPSRVPPLARRVV